MTGKQKRRGRVGLAVIFVAVAAILAVVIDKSLELHETLNTKRWELGRLNDSISEAEEETENIKTELKYRQTDDYIEDEARDLGLRYPDEIILVPKEEEE